MILVPIRELHKITLIMKGSNQPFQDYNYEQYDRQDYQHFLERPHQNHPPELTNPLSEIQSKIHIINLELNVNYPEQPFI